MPKSRQLTPLDEISSTAGLETFMYSPLPTNTTLLSYLQRAGSNLYSPTSDCFCTLSPLTPGRQASRSFTEERAASGWGSCQMLAIKPTNYPICLLSSSFSLKWIMFFFCSKLSLPLVLPLICFILRSLSLLIIYPLVSNSCVLMLIPCHQYLNMLKSAQIEAKIKQPSSTWGTTPTLPRLISPIIVRNVKTSFYKIYHRYRNPMLVNN